MKVGERLRLFAGLVPAWKYARPALVKKSSRPFWVAAGRSVERGLRTIRSNCCKKCNGSTA